jgi:transglutaminase-like putative cysteine protease
MLGFRPKAGAPVERQAASPRLPRVSLERALQITVALMCGLGSLLLGMAEENNLLLAIVAIFVAGVSVYVTDVQGWIRLSKTAGDVGGLAALLFAFVQFRRETSDVGLLALVNFVVYVQFVLQLKAKRTGIYWLLILLSLMQVAVAAALDVRLMFGILLACYMLVAIFALTLFYLYRESLRSQTDAAASAAGQASNAGTRARWPLHAQATCFAGSLAPQQRDSLVALPLVWISVHSYLAAMLVTAFVFYAFPRSGEMQWQSNNVQQARREVGFSSEVTLGEQGDVSESTEEVMQVWLTHRDTGRVYELDDLPLFRGIVLTNYENKRWSALRGSSQVPLTDSRVPSSKPLVLQRFRVQPVKDRVLFSIYPSYAYEISDPLVWDSIREQFKREEAEGTTSEYELLTAGLTNRRMARVVPASRAPNEAELRKLLALPPVSEEGKDPLAETKALTAELVKDIPEDDHFNRARVLTNYLRDSTRFSYSLQPVPRDPTLDPVEDFVNHTRAGHCEYFASALALMLRSVGIPARLALGFKGGEFDDDHYNVRQMDAHAWVEAYLPLDRIPPGNLSEIDSENGAWMVLDPTTANSPLAISTAEFLLQSAKRGLSAIRAGWNNYVLGMDYERQQNTIFRPLVDATMAFVTGVSEPDTWVGILAHLRSMVSPAYWGLTNGGWFSWRGAVAAIVIMLISLAAYHLGNFGLVRWRRWSQPDRGAATAGNVDVEFYRRFEALLRQHQLVRNVCQTPREFALAVGGQLAESPRTAPAASLPRQIAEMFYRVRFGRRPLDTSELEALERALSELAAALAFGNPRKPTTS